MGSKARMVKAMKLELKRTASANGFTIGELYVDGIFECFTCEDIVRPDGEAKVYGKTAIPHGEYSVEITFSPHFQRQLPLLLNVPGFEGIRIHPGNTAADTDGCILPGVVKTSTGVGRSVEAFGQLFGKLTKAKYNQSPITITITQGTENGN